MPPGWTVADKTGSGDYASTNDIGVAFGPDGGRLLLAVMTRTRSDDPKGARVERSHRRGDPDGGAAAAH